MSAVPPLLDHRSCANDPQALLDGVAYGILSVGVDGTITFANRSALAFFPTPGPVGTKLRALLSLAGVSNRAEIADAVEARTASAPMPIGLADGRTLDVSSRPLPDGGSVVALHDVSRYVREAERAARDSLTGLASRAELRDRMTRLLTQSPQQRSPIAVLTVDLDAFKRVNDTLGHSVGDILLTQVAERLRRVVGKFDMVARSASDEFVMLQADAPEPQSALAMATRLVDLLGRTYIVAGNIVNVGASVGVAISPADGEDAETLLQHADLARHRAKADGGGMFRFFQGTMDVDMQARRLLELDLRNAQALGQLEMAYQPQVRLEPYALVGFEALLRWNSPTRGIVSPGEFIPLAEQIGLIVPIGEWVLQTACREAASWPRPVSIAINVSAVQFGYGKLVQAVKSALTASGLDPSRLELEITEGVLLDDTNTVLQQLYALKALGARIAMDDFGTGYASLTYLRKFPFDKIKIDQSFVRGFDKNPDCGVIVRAAAALGLSLGIRTIVEGVETREQLERIKSDGCNEVQGYYTGRPMPAASAVALLSTGAAGFIAANRS